MTNQEKKPTIWTISFWYPPEFSGRGIHSRLESVEFTKLGFPVNVLCAGVNAARIYRGKLINDGGAMVRYLPILSVQLRPFLLRSRFSGKIVSILTNLSWLSFSMLCAWILLSNAKGNDIVKLESCERYTIILIAVAGLKKLHTISRMSLLGSDDPFSVLNMARHGQLLEYLTLYTYRTSEVVVAICSAMVGSCRQAKIAEQKVMYIPHGTDTELYQPADAVGKARIYQRLSLDPQKRYLLFVGAAIERKGIDILTDAFINLQKKYQDVELLIVGPDQFGNRSHIPGAAILDKVVENCKGKFAAEQCSHAVHWIGKVDNVSDYLKVADIFCLPTRQEGFGLVIIEAMASGLPVVVSRLDGVTTDIVSEGTGIIIPGFHASDYADAFMELLANPEMAKQMGMAARKRVISEFSIKTISIKWQTLFQTLSRGNV